MDIKKLKELTSSLSVLYIEDDKDLRKQNNELFKNLFKLVTVTSDGESALKYFKSNNYDIVITDINIPKIDGFSLIKLMQSYKKNQIFLVTTVYRAKDFQDKIKELNLKYFLTKPITKKEILDTISKVVLNLNYSTV